MSTDKMLRVNKQSPCLVCGRPDWCLIAKDSTAAICQRIEEGSVKRCGDAGYLHIFGNQPKESHEHLNRAHLLQRDNTPEIDFIALQQRYATQIKDEQISSLSHQLGLSKESLARLNLGWDGKAFTFGMSNEFGKIIGIRQRFLNGSKASVKGSKTGLFIPSDLAGCEPLLITEGPTDCAAALDLEFEAIGRPNCNSKVDMTARFAKGHRAVVIGDNDPPKEDGRQPGQEGAEKLAIKLLLYCPSVKIIYPPETIKDLRQWLRVGLTNCELKVILENTNAFNMESR